MAMIEAEEREEKEGEGRRTRRRRRRKVKAGGRRKEGRKEGEEEGGREEVSEFIVNIFNGSGPMPGSIQYEMRPQYCFLPRQSVKQLTSCLLVGTDNRHGEDPGEKHRCVTGERCCRNTSQTL